MTEKESQTFLHHEHGCVGERDGDLSKPGSNVVGQIGSTQDMGNSWKGLLLSQTPPRAIDATDRSL